MPSAMWSSPNPAEATFAGAQSQARVQAEPVAGIVAAILADRARKQAAFQDTLAQVQKTVSDQQDQPLHNALIEAQINELNTRHNNLNSDGSPNIWTSPDGTQYAVSSGGGLHKLGSDISPAGEAEANRNAATNIRKDIQEQFGMGPTAFNKVTPGDFDQSGKYVPNPQGKSAMIGDPILSYQDKGQDLPGTMFDRAPGTKNAYDYRNVFPRDQAERGKQDADTYMKYGHTGGLGGGATQGGGMSAEDARALEWARSNPNDPRAQAILQANGVH